VGSDAAGLDDCAVAIARMRGRAQPLDVLRRVAAVEAHRAVDTEPGRRVELQRDDVGDRERRGTAAGEELGEQQTGGAGAEREGAPARPHGQALDAVSGRMAAATRRCICSSSSLLAEG
jgi:hypothetical protein